MKGLLDQNILFCFLDETWIYPGMRHAYAWVDVVAEKTPQVYVQKGRCVSLSLSLSLSPPLSLPSYQTLML